MSQLTHENLILVVHNDNKAFQAIILVALSHFSRLDGELNPCFLSDLYLWVNITFKLSILGMIVNYLAYVGRRSVVHLMSQGCIIYSKCRNDITLCSAPLHNMNTLHCFHKLLHYYNVIHDFITDESDVKINTSCHSTNCSYSWWLTAHLIIRYSTYPQSKSSLCQQPARKINQLMTYPYLYSIA